MCILLGFCNSQLGLSALAQIFAQCHVQLFRRISNGYIRHGCIILCHANEMQWEEALLPCKALEFWVNKTSGDLSCTVRTEVEENHAVLFFDQAILIQNGRQHKFVGYFLCIGIFDCLNRFGSGFTLAINHSSICLFDTIPSVITIHCIVTAGNGCNLTNANFLHLFASGLHEASCGRWRFISAVQKCMNIYIFQTVPLCHFQQTEQVFHVAVYAARREQTHQVQSCAVLLAIFHRIAQSLVFKEYAVLNVLCNLDQHLINDSTSTDVGVTNFGVAHLSIRQTNVQTACTNQGVRALQILVDIRLVGSCNGVAKGILVIAETIHDNQCNWFFTHVFSPFQKQAVIKNRLPDSCNFY